MYVNAKNQNEKAIRTERLCSWEGGGSQHAATMPAASFQGLEVVPPALSHGGGAFGDLHTAERS